MRTRKDSGSRHAAEQLADLAGRLTTRDRELARLLAEHQVLTTDQCEALLGASPVTLGHRLVELARLQVVDRFRPLTQVGAGSAPYHYVLGQAGAAVLAAEQGIDPAALGYRRDQALAVAHTGRLLAQLVGVHLEAALIYQCGYNQGLGRASPEWIWRDFRQRVSRGRNHGREQRLERAAVLWALSHNFEPA